MRGDFVSELDELKAWVDGVRLLPRIVRTKDARALFEALEAQGVSRGDDLAVGTSLDDLAARLGRSKDALLASLRRCPFGF